MSRTRLIAAALFALALALWTWKLLEPNPVPEPVLKLLSVWDFLPYLAAKSLHASGYAILTILAWTAAPNRRWRVIAVAFMLLHGAGTELLQYLMPFNRTGKVTDVLIDWTGITIGVLIARWLTSEAPEQKKSAE